MEIGLPLLVFWAFVFLPSVVSVVFFNLFRIKIRSSIRTLLTSHILFFGPFGIVAPYVISFVLTAWIFELKGWPTVSWQTPIEILISSRKLTSFSPLGRWAFYYSWFLVLSTALNLLLSFIVYWALISSKSSRLANLINRLVIAFEIWDPIYFYFSPPDKETVVLDVLSSDGKYIYVGQLLEIGGGDKQESQGILLENVSKHDAATYQRIPFADGLIKEFFIPWQAIQNINIRDPEPVKPHLVLPT